jgi:hypothetical protein
MKNISLAMLVITSLVSGCAYNTSRYGASIRNVEIIKSNNINAVNVAQFKSTKPGLTSITCRAAGPIAVMPSFEGYIESAFIDELKLAGVYDPASRITLTGMLEEVDFDSMDANWTFTLIVSNNQNESFTTKSRFRFSGSFVADKACQEVAQAFGPAVQQLIGDVIQNPRFKEITRKRMSSF